VVVRDESGAVWDVSPEGLAKQIRMPDGVGIRMLRASADGRLLAIGNAAGLVTVYETERYTVLLKTTLPDSVRQISFDPQNRDLLMSSEFGHVRLVPLDARRSVGWNDLDLDALDVAYSPDGETIAFVCANGGSWFYVVREDRWIYARDHSAAVQSGRFSPDGASFASTDRRGNVVIRNVAKTISKRPRGTR
jgi:WD40 repeat protein